MKVSYPGWKKDFNTEKEVANELSKYVCKSCRTRTEKLSSNPSVSDLLSTACGCVFDVEDHRKNKLKFT
jgi:hypothetical protein